MRFEIVVPIDFNGEKITLNEAQEMLSEIIDSINKIRLEHNKAEFVNWDVKEESIKTGLIS